MRFAGQSSDNRWNVAGEPTLYLASSLGVVLAEYGRHLGEDVGLIGASHSYERDVYRLDARLQTVLDLREANVRSAIGLNDGVEQFLDRGLSRATAQFLRRTSSAEGLLVPSVAFLDDLTQWNLVLFLDKLPSEMTRFLSAQFERTIRISSSI